MQIDLIDAVVQFCVQIFPRFLFAPGNKAPRIEWVYSGDDNLSIWLDEPHPGYVCTSAGAAYLRANIQILLRPYWNGIVNYSRCDIYAPTLRKSQRVRERVTWLR